MTLKEIDKFSPVAVYGRGSNLLISHGSTKGAIIDALPQLKNFRFLQISYLKPFPREAVAKEIKKSKRVIFKKAIVVVRTNQVISLFKKGICLFDLYVYLR